MVVVITVEPVALGVVAGVVIVVVSADRGKPKTFDDTAWHRLPHGTNPLPVFTVGPHAGRKLWFDLQ